MVPAQTNLRRTRYTLIAGIANAVATILGTIAVVAAGVSSFGCGCIFIVFPLLHLLACVIDFLAYTRLGQPPTAAVYSIARTSAIMDLASGFAIVPLIMGIMKLQLLGSQPVREYFMAGHNDSSTAPAP
jgi:hypothetical protein